MLPFKLVCARTFYLPIGQSVFPVSKYRLMCEHLLEKGIAGPEDFVEPAPASDEDVLLVHTPEYVHKLRTGTLSESEACQLEVRYSQELVEAYWLCVGGTILAADCALRDGVAFNLSGGFHHAFPDHGEGFNLIKTNTEILEAVKRDVEQLGLSGDPEDTPEYKLTITLYTAAVLDTADVMRLSRVTGYDVDFIQKIADNMALSKLWIDGHPRCEEWWDEETGIISFLFHELVAQGLMLRTDRFRNGRPVYQAVNALGGDMLQ